MNPQQSVMSRRASQNCFHLAQPAVILLKPIEESWHSAGADRNMLPIPHVRAPQLARNDTRPLPRRRVLNPQQLFG